MVENKTFDSVVDEIFSMSPLEPYIVEEAVALVKSHYNQSVIAVSDHFPEIKEQLYTLGDGKNYTIVSLCFEDVYTFHLLPADKVLPFRIITNIIANVRTKHDIPNTEIEALLTRIKEPIFALSQIMKSSTRTTRKAIGFAVKETPLPSFEELQRFYECERKASYATVDAVESVIQSTNNAYLCKYCGLYHQGRAPTGQVIPEEILLNRYVTAWRRYHKV